MHNLVLPISQKMLILLHTFIAFCPFQNRHPDSTMVNIPHVTFYTVTTHCTNERYGEVSDNNTDAWATHKLYFHRCTPTKLKFRSKKQRNITAKFLLDTTSPSKIEINVRIKKNLKLSNIRTSYKNFARRDTFLNLNIILNNFITSNFNQNISVISCLYKF